MAIKMKFTLLMVPVLIALSDRGYAQENFCAKSWVAIPPKAVIQSGNIVTFVNSNDQKTSVVRSQDDDGKIVYEVQVPRPIDSIDVFLTPTSDKGLAYRSKNKLYHYSFENKKEVEIDLKSSHTCQQGDSAVFVASCDRSANQQTLYNFKSQTHMTIPAKEWSQLESHISYTHADSKNEVTIADTSTQRQETFQIPNAKDTYFQNENHVVVSKENTDLSTHLYSVGGKWKKFEDSKQRKFSGVTTTGETLIVNMKHKSGRSDIELAEANWREFDVTTEVISADGKTTRKIPGYYSDQTGKGGITKVEVPIKFSVFSEDNFAKLIRGEKVPPNLESEAFPIASSEGNWVTANSMLINLKTGKKIKLPVQLTNAPIESKDGSSLKLQSGYDTYIVDINSEKIRVFKGHIRLDENFKKWSQQKDDFGNARLKRVCVSAPINILDDNCNCSFKDAEFVKAPSLEKSKNEAKNISLSLMCGADTFNKKDWDEITPEIKKGGMSKEQAKVYLKRFQKYDGFDPKAHSQILGSILKSKLVEEEPGLVNEALKMISIFQPETYQTYYLAFKIGPRIPKKYEFKKEDNCRSKIEEQAIQRVLYGLKSKTASSTDPTTTDDWLKYRPFKEELSHLPKEQKSALIDAITESLSQGAAGTSELDGVFQSKLYYFSKKYVLNMFGEEGKPATDLAVAVRDGKNIPIILGSNNLSENTSTKYENLLDNETTYGFKFKILDEIKISETAPAGTEDNKKYSWKHDEKSYSADVSSVVREPLGKLIPKDPSPNYKALTKDGKLTGMMIIGSNLRSGNAGIVDEYLNYYQNAGFEFKPAKDIDVISFFKSSIQSGELDYLIKEAHSDGDEKNLFRSSKYGKLLEGTITRKNGKKETIYLVTPAADKYEDKLISNQEFGSWIRSRKENEPLVYFNASCNSARKVISEVAATHSRNFIPIPSMSSVLTFSNSEQNGERQMLQAFRDGKNYSGIREALSKTKNYQKGDDRFVFPDESDYDKKIRSALRQNLDITVKLKDSTGKEIHIDESIDH